MSTVPRDGRARPFLPVMLADFVLDVLPPRGLDQSILAAILIGLWVMLFFTERLGWVFVGVVVPGYLGSILAIQPITGAVVVYESLLTFALAKLVSQLLSKTGAWTEYFGRDRFFLIVFISILVRQHDQTWALPMLASWLDVQIGSDLQASQAYFSIGLVLVPLTANIFWKLDTLRGLGQLSVVVGVTYGVLAFILLPYTNLSLSSFELTYENAAIDFLANAKAQIILLVGALLAAGANLRYGWDFGGILVPGLLALLWLTPAKLGVTLIEALILLYLTRGALKLPGIRSWNLEGPRKLVFVFTLGFFLKVGLGFLVWERLDELQVTDLYGFGYLLSSLLAVKMLDKKSVPRILLPVTVVSALGFVLGSVLGFVLELLVPAELPEDTLEAPQVESLRLVESSMGVAALGRVNAEVTPPRERRLPHLQALGYEGVWEAIDEWVDADPGARRDAYDRARQAAGRMHVAIHPIGTIGPATPLEPGVVDSSPNDPGDPASRRAYAVFESEGGSLTERTGWTTAVVRPGALGPVLVVPRPADEAPVAEAASLICERIDCRVLLMAGRDFQRGASPVLDVSPVEIAVSKLANNTIVQIRSDAGVQSGHPILHVEGNLPGELELGALWPAELELDWSSPPIGTVDTSARDSVVLRVHQDDLIAELAAGGPRGFQRQPSLLTWISERRRNQVRRRAAYRAPSAAELHYLEELVALPMFAARTDEQADPLLGLYASLIGYDLWRFDHCGGRRGCVAMAEAVQTDRSGWGTMVVSRDPEAEPIAIEVPHPQRNIGTWRLGTELWQVSRARALIIAGADGRKDSADPNDPSPDPAAVGNLRTPFQALHQAMDRAWAAEPGRALALQVRGLAAYRGIDVDAVVGIGRPALSVDQVPLRLRTLFEAGALSTVERWVVSDGSPELYSLSGAGIPQLEYSSSLGDSETAVVWFSQALRADFREKAHTPFARRLAAISLEAEETSELELLASPTGLPEPAAETPELLELAETLARYGDTENLHLLRGLQRDARSEPGLALSAGVGTELARPFLVIRRGADQALVYTSRDLEGTARVNVDGGELEQALNEALFERPRIVIVEGAR